MGFFDKLMESLGLKKEGNVTKEQLVKKSENIETCSEAKAEHNKIRKSSYEFPFINDNMYLKYSYYDVNIKGTEYRDFDITKIALHEVLEFEFEPSNEYDGNAIKVLYEDIFLGYVPKNNIQSMIKDYIYDDEKDVLAMIYEVNEETKCINMAVAFYQKLTNNELKKFTYIDTKLIKTTKKDEATDSSRQDNLDSISEDEELDIDYQYSTGTYLVCDNCGYELGELSVSNSEKLHDYELSGSELHCIVQELDYNDSGNIVCKVRVFIK